MRLLGYSGSGGQYSLFRVVFGLYLLQHFLALLPWGTELFSDQGAVRDAGASPLIGLFPNVLALFDAPWAVGLLLLGGAALSVFFTLGLLDRAAAVGLWYVWACLLGRDPLIANPSLPFVGFMLLAHACLPRAPYGSWAARSRPDPDGGWVLPAPIFTAGWIVMALGYTYSGATKLTSPSWLDGSAFTHVLANPLARPTALRTLLLGLPPFVLQAASWGALAFELSFAPLALVRRLRPWPWCGMLAMHLSLFALLDFADLTAGMVLVHLWTFDPAWIRAVPSATPAVVFYDGTCALCHGFVRFLLAEDRTGAAFRFAPLQSQAFREATGKAAAADLPDSVVVRAADGQLLTRSAAVLHVAERLGGWWRLLGLAASTVPRPVRDLVYDLVARVRYRIFGRTREACPLIPPRLRDRFLL